MGFRRDVAPAEAKLIRCKRVISIDTIPQRVVERLDGAIANEPYATQA